MITAPNAPTPPPAPVRERHKPLCDWYAREVAKLRRARENDYIDYVARSIDKAARNKKRRYG